MAVDSDGCAMDSMGLKQRRCFIPATIDAWGLHDVEAAAREMAEFVNLHSRWRGVNRFVALVKTFELLSRRVEVRQRSVALPDTTALRRWLAEEPSPSNQTLVSACGRDACGALERVLAWSREVNRRVASLADGEVLPFPAVGSCVAAVAAVADVVVVSAAPEETLAREWSRAGLAGHARWIAGQEAGSKAVLLRALSARYAPGCSLMVGDAPGDLDAAREAGMLFWPICPGDEDASWRRFVPEGLERFCDGTLARAPEEAGVRTFLAGLPETPPWPGQTHGT